MLIAKIDVALYAELRAATYAACRKAGIERETPTYFAILFATFGLAYGGLFSPWRGDLMAPWQAMLAARSATL